MKNYVLAVAAFALVVMGGVALYQNRQATQESATPTSDATVEPTLTTESTPATTTAVTSDTAPVISTPEEPAAAKPCTGLHYYKMEYACLSSVHLIGALAVPKDYTDSINSRWDENLTYAFEQIETFFEREFNGKLEITWSVIDTPYVSTQTLEEMRGNFEKDSSGNFIHTSWDDQQSKMRNSVGELYRKTITPSAAYERALASGESSGETVPFVFFNEATMTTSVPMILGDKTLIDQNTVDAKYADGQPALQRGVRDIAYALGSRWNMPTAASLGYNPVSDANGYFMGPHPSYTVFLDHFVLPEVKRDMGLNE